MKHVANPEFWESFHQLPIEIQINAKKCFKLLKENPYHPSLHFKNVDGYYSVRIGKRYRAIGIESDNTIIWFWIGSHSNYDNII